jgi:Zn-dependent protease
MIKPAFLQPEDQPTVVGHVFGTPMVVRGWTGFPLIELVAWAILSMVAGQKRPDWSWHKRICAGALTSTILLGSEWSHNLAHTAVAYIIGQPVDAIRIFFGTPLLIYYDINDQKVISHEHLLRALGGPVFNALMIPLFWLIKQFTPAGSLARYNANFALGTNIVLSTVSLLPIPGIDGGPLLKWSLVETGRTPELADEIVKKVNLTLGSVLGITAGLAVKKRRKWLGAFFAAFAATSLAYGIGFLKEQK